MHEKYKLSEAHYFLERMRAEHDSRTNFRFELSALLGAARSVLQYALEEARSKPGGQQWYDQAITREPLLAYFKTQRDVNIHTVPVKTATKMTTHISDFLRIEDDGEEMIVPYKHLTSTVHHHFADRTGEETAIELSERYLNALQAFIAHGVAQGMVTG